MDEVLKSMKAAGILVVVSAGNEGPGCGTMSAQPASHGLNALTVGAYDYRFERIAYFSSRGPTSFDQQVGPDVVAPGVAIRSSVPGKRYEGGWMGTSKAGPHVAGVATLMWSANPALKGNIDETINIIRKTATPKESSQECGGVSGKAIPNAVFGYGVVNAYEAVRAAMAR
jgi:subtilisin family serine protease